MKSVCVIGWPVEHSLSPLVHGHWLDRMGIDGRYVKNAVPPERAADFLGRLAEYGYAGCNITVPLKQIAFEAAARREPSAVAVGAANTAWLQDGALCVANTDTYGFMTNLDQCAPQWRDWDAPVALLGAGGAARAIIHGLLEANVHEVRVFNRTPARADELAAHFGARVVPMPWPERLAQTRDAGVLVNTTSLGLVGGDALEFSCAGLDPRCIVADIVYRPLETPLLADARRDGLATVDGLGMLLHQAVPGFERWFGVRPQVNEELHAILLRALEPGPC